MVGILNYVRSQVPLALIKLRKINRVCLWLGPHLMFVDSYGNAIFSD